jgi:hypothetical protein
VTFDNKMPVQHAALLLQYDTTLAVIDKLAEPPELTREEYWREVMHRHAHRMANQDAGSAWKYRRAGRRESKPWGNTTRQERYSRWPQHPDPAPQPG